MDNKQTETSETMYVNKGIKREDIKVMPATAYTVMPQRSSRVSIKVIPDSICTLHQALDNLPEKGMRLYPDENGFISIHVQPTKESELAGSIVIDCEKDGKVVRYPIQLRAHSKSTKEMPFPIDEMGATKSKNSSVRRKLTDDEINNMKDEELVKMGFPPKPDAKKMPDAYTAWLKMVSVAFNINNSKVNIYGPPPGPPSNSTSGVDNAPGLGSTSTIQQASLPNGCGFERISADGTYNFVTGTFYVPALTGEPGVGVSDIWVGIDSETTTDWMQVGVHQEVYVLNIFGLTMHIVTYTAFTYLSPRDGGLQLMPNIPIKAGDQIYLAILILNNQALYFFSNQTANVGRFTSAEPNSPTQLKGNRVEWMVSRTTGYLPDFGNILMNNAYANQNLDYATDIPGTQVDQITMNGNGKTLAIAYPLFDTTIQFVWRAFN